MKTLKWLAVTTLLVGCSTMAFAQNGPGIGTEGQVLPPQSNGSGYSRGYGDYYAPRHHNSVRPHTLYHRGYRDQYGDRDYR
jgi:hypothetical protein